MTGKSTDTEAFVRGMFRKECEWDGTWYAESLKYCPHCKRVNIDHASFNTYSAWNNTQPLSTNTPTDVVDTEKIIE